MKIRADRKIKMRHPLERQITVVTTLLIIGTIALCLLIESIFLEKYYMNNKVNRIAKTYSELDELSRNSKYYSDEFILKFEKVSVDSNMDVQIMTPSGEVVCSSSVNRDNTRDLFLSILFDLDRSGKRREMRHEDNYVIYRDLDMRLKSEYLLLWGIMNDGNIIVIRSTVVGVKDAVVLSRNFTVIVSIFACVGAFFISRYMARRLAKPIVQLSDISRRMANLDFTAKYPEGILEGSEVDDLGHNINVMSHSLENTVSELKTANNELMKDNEKKTQIDEMRKEFLSNVSHELKTPLALIQGYAEGLKECLNDDPESVDFYCDVIMDETERMTRMVQKLLTLNRLEFGSQTVEMERFNLTELVGGVAGSMKVMMEQKGIELIFDEPDTYVWADEYSVEDVVTNYISNAINHCDGEKKIRIFMMDMGKTIRLNVENTGECIPEDELDKIWIKFYKVDKARTREYGGSGIGLSIVKAIMESMNGEYGVYNTQNGVCFYCDFEK